MFQGFSKDSIKFLKELKKNNNKKWFLDHRGDYESTLLDPLKNLVSDLGDFMLSIDPNFEIRPQINKTISRIHRDTRFSRDKSPYKTSLWITFKQPNKNWKDAPAYFFEITPDFYHFGMGFYCATPDTMKKFRNLVDAKPKEFQKLISNFKKQRKFKLEGEKYKRIFDPNKSEKIQEWYQRKNFYLVSKREINNILFSKKLVDELASGFKALEDFYHFFLKIKQKL